MCECVRARRGTPREEETDGRNWSVWFSVAPSPPPLPSVSAVNWTFLKYISRQGRVVVTSRIIMLIILINKCIHLCIYALYEIEFTRGRPAKHISSLSQSGNPIITAIAGYCCEWLKASKINKERRDRERERERQTDRPTDSKISLKKNHWDIDRNAARLSFPTVPVYACVSVCVT